MREGKHTMTEALEMAGNYEQAIKDLIERSPLPETPDYEAVDSWLISAYQRSWAERGQEE